MENNILYLEATNLNVYLIQNAFIGTPRIMFYQIYGHSMAQLVDTNISLTNTYSRQEKQMMNFLGLNYLSEVYFRANVQITPLTWDEPQNKLNYKDTTFKDKLNFR